MAGCRRGSDRREKKFSTGGARGSSSRTRKAGKGWDKGKGTAKAYLEDEHDGGIGREDERGGL